MTKGRFDQPIEEVEIEKPWAEKHWRAIELAYRPARSSISSRPRYAELVRARRRREPELTGVNELFLRELAALLGLGTRIVRDSAYPAEGIKTTRLLNIAKAAGADRYLSGPAARVYLDEAQLADAGIATEWMSYQGYGEYPQLHGDFDHAVTVLDLLFNTGPEASRFLRREVTG